MLACAHTLRRIGCIVATTGLITIGAVCGMPGVASADGFGDGVYVACPDTTTLAYATTPSCESLADAIADAEGWNNTVDNTRENATIDLLPGEYCPVQLPYDPYPLTIQGVGVAGLANASDATGYTGFEADLSEFVWQDSCTAIDGDDYFLENLLNPSEPGEQWGDITLDNFAINGDAGGADNGIYIQGAGLGARDLLIENLPGTGFDRPYTNYYNGDISASAFIDNGVGADISAGDNTGVSIDASTFAGNTTGVEGGGFFNLGEDTIAHNGTGIAGSASQLVGSLVGDNTSYNCNASISSTFDDVVGASCPDSGSGDVSLTSTIGSVSTGGGITPSIQPVAEAEHVPSGGDCGTIDGTDQEELVVDTSDCYAGSVQPAGTAADPSPSAAIDFGSVPTNEPATQSASLSAGGGLVGISGVDVSDVVGTGSFSVTTDGCTYNPLVVEEFGQGACQVYVQATSTDTSGTTTGTLTFHTTDGDFTVALSSTGAPAITASAAPTNLTATAGNHGVTLQWDQVSEIGGAPYLDYYDVEGSTTGTSFTSYDENYDTSDATVTDTITGLTNGTTYYFKIRAENGIVDGTYSTVVSVTPHGPTQASAFSALSPAVKTIAAGTAVSLSATLTNAVSHAPLPNATVNVLTRPGHSGTFGTLTTTSTGPTGVAKLTVTPTRDVQYELSYAGAAGHGAVTSSISTVTVDRVVTAALTKKKVKHHKSVEVYGAIAPASSGVTLSLQREVKGKWKTVAAAKTRKQRLPNGKTEIGYVVKYRPKSKGKQALRVACPATTANGAGTSTTLTLKVT